MTEIGFWRSANVPLNSPGVRTMKSYVEPTDAGGWVYSQRIRKAKMEIPELGQD